MINMLSSAAATLQVEGLDGIDFGAGHGTDVTGIIAVVMAFALPAVIVIAVLLYRLRQQRLQNEIIAKLAASGQSIPPELLVTRCARSNLSRGLTLLAVGMALALAFYLTGQHHAWPWALIPVFIGIARLLSWAIEERAQGSR
ncbi:DUF6249 domain-containing protein [Solimonas soli]|uniref:DUF6249 domain-containing protein n=1 Tax=Solimonas soli TaxID=413479 RepID=UPI0004883347|nr:DUF6249 domain-containing protein [Solimonas soli]